MKPRPRFPPVQIRPDGSKGCRGCGGQIPKNRQTWCSHECHLKFDPFYVKQAVMDRAEGKCENPECRADLSRSARSKHYEQMPKSPTYAECGLGYPYNSNALMDHPLYQAYIEKMAAWRKAEPKPEYDHIIPHSEGGDFTPENIRVLCRKCHLKRTAEWRRNKKLKPKSEKITTADISVLGLLQKRSGH